jgi:hypothetical protein
MLTIQLYQKPVEIRWRFLGDPVHFPRGAAFCLDKNVFRLHNVAVIALTSRQLD